MPFWARTASESQYRTRHRAHGVALMLGLSSCEVARRRRSVGTLGRRSRGSSSSSAGTQSVGRDRRSDRRRWMSKVVVTGVWARAKREREERVGTRRGERCYDGTSEGIVVFGGRG